MKPILKTIERLAVAAGLLLSFLVVMELLRAYETLRGITPWAGYGFLVLLAVLAGYVVWQVRLLFTLRAAPVPPELPAEGEVSAGQMRSFVRCSMSTVPISGNCAEMWRRWKRPWAMVSCSVRR